MITNELIFHAGLGLVSLALLSAVIGIPILILSGGKLKRRLDSDYGLPNANETGRSAKKASGGLGAKL